MIENGGMPKDIISVTPLADWRLRDPAFFDQVRVNDELGSIEWPNGADLDPDVLYARVAGRPLPEFVLR